MRLVIRSMTFDLGGAAGTTVVLRCDDLVVRFVNAENER